MVESKLAPGKIVRVRSRQYLVEEVEPSQLDTLVRLSCLEDDALGEEIQVFWEREIDAQYLGENTWDKVANQGFDQADLFSAYLHALRWNCVTATDPELFQAPYRAGIEIKAYQLEPLRKALSMPRIALFIADDVGLGKTIEAGIVLREMLMRQKVRWVLIACPPSVVKQWQEEMENRFGLSFMIFDRDFVAQRRQERGYGVNPWKTHTRFIISHALLRDENYAAPLRDCLGDFMAGSMLILDEAHNAAPASGSRYAVDSQLTKTIRSLADKFEHKLFLSATPHNGHSNSFAALLEMLDPQRFCRGVPVTDNSLLDTVMVRRLKQDLRSLGNDFPERLIIPILINNLPANTPELRLSELLQEYRILREERLKGVCRSQQNMAMLVIINLQKRLLSSIEAFARTLKVHQQTLARQQEKIQDAIIQPKVIQPERLVLLKESVGADDDRADLLEADVEQEEDQQMRLATGQDLLISERERQILDEMMNIANENRCQADQKVKRLIDWIKDNMCPNLGEAGAEWLERRVLIFTEYTDTKRYLEQQLEGAIADSHLANKRIRFFHGGMSEDERQEIKAAFNESPSKHPLRILIATDAAREGVNLQNNCADLFHFDIPWNPSRMEQRNGRIDRKLQRSPEVRCYYFIYPQRVEDRVLEVVIEKTKVIQEQLGSLSPVVERHITEVLQGGISHAQMANITELIKRAEVVGAVTENSQNIQNNSQVIGQELESKCRLKKNDLRKRVKELEELLHKSWKWLDLDDDLFRKTISASLQILKVSGLQQIDQERKRWEIPNLQSLTATDPSWLLAVDSLRQPRQRRQNIIDWRRESPIRPVVFEDPESLDGEVVHLHLEHKIVQRLLGRFLAQGFSQDQLQRACICLSDDPIPLVIILGRLSLYGDRASRLHDQVIMMAAEWENVEVRGKRKLKPLLMGEMERVTNLLENSLKEYGSRSVSDGVKQLLLAGVSRDISDLQGALEKRAEQLSEAAEVKLTKRGEKEATEMRLILQKQRQRIEDKYRSTDVEQLTLFPEMEKKQVEADRRYWLQRLKYLENELETEPARIRQVYQVKTRRIEPVGVVYLYPVSS
jgi:ERCC4-related helicase